MILIISVSGALRNILIVSNAPLEVLHPLPVISLKFYFAVSLISPPLQFPKSGPFHPQASPKPRSLIPAQKCDTESPVCGPCRRSRANLECFYDPTNPGPQPLPLRRGEACLPCRCVSPCASTSSPPTDNVLPAVRKR